MGELARQRLRGRGCLQISLFQKRFHLLRGGGAAALTDAGLAAAASVQGGVQCLGQGAHIAVPPGKAVAGALFGGGQGGAQAGGGFGQADSQPVQPVRVQPRQGADGVCIGRGQLRKGVKQLAAQSEVCKL